MKYKATLPESAGQYAGTHTFGTKRQRDGFLQGLAREGVSVEGVKLSPESMRRPVIAAAKPKPAPSA